MTTTHIRLKQEGWVRAEGFQTTQWTAAVPAGATDPDSLEQLFLIRQTSGVEFFERVARILDFANYPANELKFFEAKRAGGNVVDAALPGDVIRFTPSIPFWLQADAPYADADFIVDAVVDRATGVAPQAIAGNLVRLPGYEPRDADVGRWITLTGFASPSYNATVEVLQVVGDTFKVALAITTNETGATWRLRRIRIQTNLGPALEPRYFPTVVRERGWQLRRGLTVVTSGSYGYTERTDPLAPLFRDRRMTTLEPTLQAALARMETVRNGVQLLQTASSIEDTSFATLQTFDFPPP